MSTTEPHQFKDQNEKIAYINTQVAAQQSKLKEGDNYFNQMLFKEAKQSFVEGSKVIMDLIKLTADDANFQVYLKSQMQYALSRAEMCARNLGQQLMSKNAAGYAKGNLVKDAFTELKQQIQQDQQNAGQHRELAGLLSNQEKMDHDAEELRKQLDNLPSPAQNPVPPAGGAAQPQEEAKGEQKKEESKSKVDPAIRESIQDSVLEGNPNVKWDDIKGLADVKKILNETIVLPALRPDIFSGLYAPSKGILLYGPPGTGKTLLAKAVATECKSTFFSISASTLTSKWMGEGEKLMRGLFAMALEQAPSVIFFDEIDSIMGARGGNEHEASRRLKTEFLVQFDGVNGAQQQEGKNLLVLAATNRPGDLDEAALRRLTRRIYIPLPDAPAREAIISHQIAKINHDIDEEGMKEVLRITEGYSCADMQAMIKEAAMQPVRELSPDELLNIKDSSAMRKVNAGDFAKAVASQSPSVSAATIAEFDAWRKDKGAV